MANYVLSGSLDVTGDVLITGTVYECRSLSALVNKLEEGGYKDIMQLTNNERTIDKLEVGNLILVTFECREQSILNVLGESSSINIEVLE